MGKIGEDKLMRKYFSERSYLIRLILHLLKAVAHLNEKGQYHGDINTANIIIRFNLQQLDTFRVQLIEGLHIKELVEHAMIDQGMPHNSILTRYDPPERKTVSVPADERWDMWAIGCVVFESLLCLKLGDTDDGDFD